MGLEEITVDMWLEFKRNRGVEIRNTIIMHYLHLVKETASRLIP